MLKNDKIKTITCIEVYKLQKVWTKSECNSCYSRLHKTLSKR